MNKVRKLATNKNRAESLVEVIIAIFVVALGAGIGTSLIVTALQSNTFSRDNLIAMNLATEGLEAVRSIRDTNWLKYSFDRNNCWNLRPESKCEAPFDDSKKIAAGNYSVDLNPVTIKPGDNSWGLTAIVGGDLDLNKALQVNQSYRLGAVDLNLQRDSNQDGKSDNDKDIYVTSSAIQNLKLTGTGDSQFYRMIQISYNDPNNVDPLKSEVMVAVSTVQWKAQGTVHQISLNTELTNYQKVKAK